MGSLGYDAYVISRRRLVLLPVAESMIPAGRDPVREYFYNYWFVHRHGRLTLEEIPAILDRLRREGWKISK
jgi:hypothetical protein